MTDATPTTPVSDDRGRIPRRVYRGLAWLLAATIVVQVALAGLAAFDQPVAWLWHRRFANVLETVALLLLLIALVWRLRGLRVRAGLLVLLIGAQHGLAAVAGVAGALHAANALVLMLLAHRAGHQAARPLDQASPPSRDTVAR